MKNLKISSKISVAFAIVNGIYILGIIGLLLSYMMSNDRLNNMNNTAVTPQIAIGDVTEAILRERVAADQLVLLKPGTAEYTAVMETCTAEKQKVLDAIAVYRDASDENGKAAADEMQAYYEKEYSAYISELIRLATQDDDTAAMAKISSSADIETTMDARIETAAGLIRDKIAYFIYNAWFGLIRLFIIAAAVIILIVFIIIYIIKYVQRNISRKIEDLTAAADLLATGNLNIDISAENTDEIGMLTKSFLAMAESINEQAQTLSAISEGDLTVDIAPRSDSDTMNIAIKKMIDNLNHMFAQISGSTDQVSMGAKQIAEGSQSLAQGATEQATTVDQLSNSIAEVARSTQDNSLMAQQAAELMKAVNNNATSGSQQMSKMAQAVQDISAASQSISKVMKAIDDIAFQTNILSLNAAVEAARAGQHGKGFAVVADEVRNLASKSAAAAKDTGVLIENSIEKAVLGARIAEETVASFEQIVAGINESTNLLNDIAKASEQQSIAVNSIDEGIVQVAQVVQQNSATAEESAASSEELRGQSELLQGLTSHFKTKHSLLGGGGYALPSARYGDSFTDE